MNKERNQNLVVGDNVNLRLFTYNSNSRQNVSSIDQIDIYQLDKSLISQENPDGRRLVESVTSFEVVDDPFGGQYLASISLEDQVYTIGNYLDVWSVSFNQDQQGTVENQFSVLPNLWYASDAPIIYDFSFGFRPNRIRKGERRWININVVPNVPEISDLKRYYANLAVSSPLYINIEQICGDCVPNEKDLRMIVEKELVSNRRGTEGSYFIDTELLEMPLGMYNIWFEMEFGENKYLSDNIQLQIF